MKALILSPRHGILKETDIPKSYGVKELGEIVHGTIMTAYRGDDFIMLAAAEAEQRAYNLNPRASAAAGENIFGRVIVFGCKGETWCDLAPETKEYIRSVKLWTRKHRERSANCTADRARRCPRYPKS